MNYIPFKSQRYKKEIKITVVLLLTVNEKVAALRMERRFFCTK